MALSSEAFDNAFYDPLTINLAKQMRALVAFSSTQSAGASSPLLSLLSSLSTSMTTTKESLGVLSRCLAEPSLTNIVADLFRPLLIDLCARWLGRGSDEEEENKFIAFCLLIENHEELFPVLYAFLRQPHLDRGPLAFVEGDLLSIPALDITRLQRLLLAYYRLLRANRLLPSELLWPAFALSALFASQTPHLDPAVKYLAIRCYALHTGMAEVDRLKFEREVFGEEVEKGKKEFDMVYDLSGSGKEEVVDARVMPVLEMKRIHEVRSAMMMPHDFHALEEGDVSQCISESDLSPWVVNIHGVLMLKSSPTPLPPSQVVFTPSAICALRSLAMHVSLRLPTLISSPPSSGKSLFLTHLASMLYPNVKDQIVTVHLADTSLDPRSLLGSYVSSPTRLGTFEWKDGVVVRAMKEGKWLVFEDIDKGSMEVLGLIKPLAESMGPGKWIGGRARIVVPNREKVYAAEGFAVFATRSVLLVSGTANGTKIPEPTFYGASKFSEVVVDVPSVREVRMIVSERFPEIVPVIRRAIVRMWMAIMGVGTTVSTVPIGLRELEKFFTRVRGLVLSLDTAMEVDSGADEGEGGDGEGIILPSIFPNIAVREEMYLEARDVFFGGGALTGPARAHQERVALVVAEHLGLDEDRRKWVLQGCGPTFGVEKDVNGDTTDVHVGRARLPARAEKATMLITSPTRPFALHKPALRLLSRIATAVSFCEPILLTGETGTGKTSAITHLATLLRRPLVSLNLSHQTESSDLLGGFKPVDARVPAGELSVRFVELFGATFSRKRNVKFEESVRKAVQEGRWKRAVILWKEAIRLAKERIEGRVTEGVEEEAGVGKMEGPRKRRKVDDRMLQASQAAWEMFERDVDEFDIQHTQDQGKFAFDFVEGPLVRALRLGHWVLLDEINLASSETLECVAALLNGPSASITLTEKGSLEAVHRHPDFRLFACMNPATDVGKKDLPPNIRARFTEIDVPLPDQDRETLLHIVHQYIGHCAVGDKAAIMDVAEFYAAVKKLVDERQLADGADRRPHFSMRTLARALTFAADVAPSYGLRRALWEGCLMAFTMVLAGQSATIVIGLAQKHILAGMRNPKSVLSMEPAPPSSRSINDFVKFGPFYLERGPLPEDPMEDYIMTPSVEKKLVDLARIILTRRFPVLIEGPTSSGKTSAVQYLARRTGHHFIRINNHEHTDIQEYIGSYVSDPVTGKLVFKDGLLVHALRHGHWIVLDELNLAPTEVLEALNRLLDDNRELVISETHEVVRPHPHFMLFATQNPPGLYGGRKVLSRAFRNRFLEVHFQDVPQAELEVILCQRCRIAPSYGQRIVSVFHELQQRRQVGRVFESKQGFATLRDLFRWAGRDAVGYQELAENGYMLLAERARREEDKLVVKEVIESVMKVRIDEMALYDLHRSKEFEAYIGCPVPSSSQVIWTYAMRRLFVLVARALRFNEPVLLVGETGSGKTSVCQLYAEVISKHLHTLSCHQNTETADAIGGLRPARSRFSLDPRTFQDAVSVLGRAGLLEVPSDAQGLLARADEVLQTDIEDSLRTSLLELRSTLLKSQALFQWDDGPLLRAMREGDVFLLDEISLADDSVLERLNSVLEPERTIVLAERGGIGGEYPVIHAAETFKLLATMNPGGDYGKKELSPALRNRFTEIWVPPVDNPQDLTIIINNSWRHEKLRPFTAPLLAFCHWLRARLDDNTVCTLRDILAWVAFSNAVFTRLEDAIHVNEIFHHAAYMTFLDGLGSLSQTVTYSPESLQNLRNESACKLDELVPYVENPSFTYDPSLYMQFGQFAIPRGPEVVSIDGFNLNAPTTRENVIRVARACQLEKPILLEGSPGVGKTSLVAALAKLAGYRLCRINLSDQTDLIDLFGSDLPAESGAPGEFVWKDAEFLRAMQEGHWVLLDEMNLAPQTVLEGLNAILDHRGTVFVPELGRTFVRHPSFRVFAAQNPLHQGGGRKGLPKSFLDRFTKVYVKELTPEDLFIICREQLSGFDDQLLQGMITFNTLLSRAVVQQRLFGREGSPWEFNLRDIIRWVELLRASGISDHPRHFLRTIYLSRFRDVEDRRKAQAIFNQVFPTPTSELLDTYIPPPIISFSHVQIGHFSASRGNVVQQFRPTDFLQAHSAALETIWACIARSWPVIVTGQRDIGKTSLIRTLADLSGNHLDEVSVTGATDTSDILGGFEQVDQSAKMTSIVTRILELTEDIMRSIPGVKHRYPGQATLRNEMSSSPKTRITVLQAASQLLAELSMLESNGPDFKPRWQRLHLAVLELSQAEVAAGRFEWVDGPLIQAMKKGHWLVLDAANTCNPSVLDRLNSLCEPNGVLVLTERGLSRGEVEILKPHPNFRLFMTVDPQYGELSRAMRNRGLEVSLVPPFTREDQYRVSAYHRLPNGVVSSHVDFEGRRRGILLNQGDELSTAIASANMTNDRISSMLATLAPVITTDVTSPLFTIVPFVMRALPRSVLPLLRHLLCTMPSASAISTIFGDPFLLDITTALTRLWKEPITGVARQLVDVLPLDDFTVCPPCSRCMEYQQAHLLRLQILDFFAALVVDKVERGEQITPTGSSLPTVVTESIQAILVEVQAASKSLCESFICGTGTFQIEDFSISVKLLGLARRLRRVLTGDVFDYSTAQVLARSISTVLENHPHTYDRVASASTIFDTAISSSSGLGLMAIWSELRNDRMIELGPLTIHQLEYDLQIRGYERLKTSPRERFQTLALATLPSSLIHGFEYMNVFNQIKSYLSDGFRKAELSPESAVSNSVSLLVELQAICEMRGHDPKISSVAFARLIQIALENHDDLRRFVPYQHVIWTLENAAEIPENVVVTLLTLWLESLWNHEPTQTLNAEQYQDAFEGPSIIFRPTLLFSTLQKCQTTGVSLSSLEQHEVSIQQHLQSVVQQCYTCRSRFQQLTALFNQSLAILSSSFSSFFDDHQLQTLRRCRSGFSLDDTKTLLATLDGAPFKPLRDAIQHLVPALATDFAKAPLTVAIARLGRCWVALSRVILELIVPDIPLDPAAILRRSTEFLQEEIQTLTDQITLHGHLESRTVGNETNPVISHLTVRAQERTALLQLRTGIPDRNNVSRLSFFWTEVSQFVKQVLQYSRIDDLLASLESNSTSTFSREDVVQDSISKFVLRLTGLYPEYNDIVQILRFAFSQLRLGLRLARHAYGSAGTHLDNDSYVASLVAFPHIRSISTLLQAPISVGSGVTRAEHLLITIAAAADYRRSGGLVPQAGVVFTSYEQAFRLWAIDRTRDEKKEQDLGSLYRGGTSSHDVDEEAEMEREFLELFPTFEDGLLDERSSAGAAKGASHHLSAQHRHQLLVLHLQLMDIDETHPYDSEEIRRSALRSCLEANIMSCSDLLDRDTLHLQVSLLQEYLGVIRNSCSTRTKTSNFYVDPNIFEAKKALKVARSLRSRIVTILREWPDQMILQHLLTRCDVVLALDLNSPVAKLLSALENLLLQTEDWEMYAHREVSLTDDRQAITNLIVEWRRLELSSWKSLLDSQCQLFVDAVAEYWFHLYELLIRGPLNAVGEDSGNLSKYLQQMPYLLDDFMRTSSLGQFHARLKLLKSFETLIGHMLENSATQSTALRSVMPIVHFSWRFFHLYLPQLSQSLEDQRRSLEKEVDTLIRLASWREVNVQALKQSARKTHHQLYKVIRKFRDALRQPVAQKLSSLLIESTEGARQPELLMCHRIHGHPFSRPFLPNTTISAPPSSAHLGNLVKLFGKFHSYVDGRIRRFLAQRTAYDVEQLSINIILRAKDLAGQTVPEGLNKEQREKYRKGLLTRKRKAWSDLLKELKRGGLAYRLKTDTASKLGDESWIRGQPLMPSSNIIAAERGEVYFDRLRGCLPVLRKALLDHHSDINTRDLSRGICLTESGFALALETRSTLAHVLSNHAILQHQTSRLRAIADSSVLARIESLEKVEQLRLALSLTASALEELTEAIRVFGRTEETTDVAPLLHECQALSLLSHTSRDRVTDLLARGRSVMREILLGDEYTTVVEASHLLVSLPTRLDEMTSSFPHLAHVLVPTAQWVRDQGTFSFPEISAPHIDPTSGIDTLINTLLVTVQNMLGKVPDLSSPTTTVSSSDQPADNYIHNGARDASVFTSLLDLPSITERISQVSAGLLLLPYEPLQAALKRMLPFLHYFLDFSGELLENQARWTTELLKLDYVVCSVLHTLATRGFCIPPETEGDETAKSEEGKGLEGTGIGEGAGAENVSKEITDESQVEGLQGEGNDMEKGEGNGDENAIEMNEPFEGEMEDVEDDEDGDGEEESPEDAEGPDEQLGKLDQADPNKVDEKLWGDEPGEDGEDQQEELQQDRSGQASDESNVVAKGRESAKSNKKEEATKETTNTTDECEEEDEEDMQEEERGSPNAAGAPMDEYIPDANTLDLPEDMNLDNDKEGGCESDMNESMAEVEDEDTPTDEDTRKPDINESHNPSTADDETYSNGGPPHATEEPMDEMDTDGGDEKQEANAVAQPDLMRDNGDAGMTGRSSQLQDSTTHAQKETASSHAQEGTIGEESAAETEQRSSDAPASQPEPQVSSEPAPTQVIPEVGSDSDASRSGPAYAQRAPTSAPRSDPLRKLGDVLKEIQQRFDEIFSAPEQTRPQERAPKSDDAEQVMYEHDENEDGIQALGHSTEEPVAKLKELTLVEKNPEEHEVVAIDAPVSEIVEARDVAMEHLHAGRTAHQMDVDLEGAIAHTERDKAMQGASTQAPVDKFSTRTTEDESEAELPSVTNEVVRATLESLTSSPDTADVSAYIQLWTLYTSLIMPLSIALCESLRLILAPTLATRLRGDFRTGKRLNMRRVIAWVASEYTKDRIWLRRVKPSARAYQVLLAVDDSASMRGGGGGAVHLAYQTVVLVAQALGRLEAGEVGVARFGAGWELVRGFGEGARDWGSSPVLGGRVLSALTFRQQRTDVAGFLEGSLGVLETAREAAGSRGATKDLWQLEIIISDGICQEHERLRRALRRARSMRVLVVFIVLDALNEGSSTLLPDASNTTATASSAASGSQSSILALNQVSYRQSPTTGQMELTMERYLDSFPFEYYVVLRDVEALPRVLADTLREFFEKVNEA
ncbi:midasin [Pisolithus thermaeus]|nr:midasin [Pisolithus thermaeus]